MKKTKIACALIILFAITLVGTLAFTASKQPQYYANAYATMHLLSSYDADDSGRDTATDVGQHNKDFALSVFNDLSDLYKIEKSNPNVGYFHTHDNIEAQYSHGWIYINFDNYNNIEDARSAIAHELTHYLSDNGRFFGFHYTLDDTYIFGNKFTEGVTNYFSTKYASNSNYQYETHIAKLMTICYGEDALSNDFFASDVSALRNDFNTSVKKYYKNEIYDSLTLTPFDVMTSFLNTYSEPVDDAVRINSMLAIDEMLLYYAKQKGYESEVKEEILNFATTNNLDYLTKVL